MAIDVSQFTDTRRIGDAVITIISEGVLPWNPKLQTPELEWRRAMPEADAEGRLPLGLNLAHIRLGDASILIDPGFEDPAIAHDPYPGLTRSPGLRTALHALGISPEEITHVLITHTHSDHYAGVTTMRDGKRVPRYPRARHYVGRADWESNPQRANSDSGLVMHLGALARLELLELVDDEREIVPGVAMIAAPGESAGHCVVRAHSGGETFYYLGDLVHHPCEVEHPYWIPMGRDGEALAASRGRILIDMLASNALAVFTHERFPPWGRVVMTDAGCRWEKA